MYMLKICRCCDRIIGELDTEESRILGTDNSLEVVGNIAYTVCSPCMQELNLDGISYYQ